MEFDYFNFLSLIVALLSFIIALVKVLQLLGVITKENRADVKALIDKLVEIMKAGVGKNDAKLPM